MAGTLGRALGNLFMDGIAKIPGVDLQREKDARKQKAIQDIVGKSFSGLEQQIASGMDAGKAQIQAIARASAQMAADGYTEEATALRQKLVESVQAYETQQLERSKLKAETAYKRTQIMDALAPEEPDEPKDELSRMQERRELLTAALQRNPDSEALNDQLDEVNARINKIVTVTGRTEADERAMSPTKPTLNKIQESFINTAERLDGMRRIADSYDPEALTFGGKAKKWFYTAKEITGLDLSPEEKAELRKQSTFAQNTVQELNLYIRSITGAAITVQEAGRLMKGMPNETDSPTVFKTKMQNVLQQLEAVQRRQIDVLKSGDLTFMATPLTDYIEFDFTNFDPTTASDAEVDAFIDAL